MPVRPALRALLFGLVAIALAACGNDVTSPSSFRYQTVIISPSGGFPGGRGASVSFTAGMINNLGEPNRLFRREGSHIFCRVPIPMTTAALGGDIEVPTIEGKRLRVAVPAGSQTGKQTRMRGKGMTELHGHARGDMLVEFVVETPVNLTKRQQELLREFEGEFGNEGVKANGHHPESEGFFAKVKELWDELTD